MSKGSSNALGTGAWFIEACPAGHTCAQGVATACASGTYRNSTGGVADSCLACPAGYISGTGALVCSPCPSGSYRSSASQCELCESGKYSNSSAAVRCTLCAQGFFGGGANQTSCESCMAGTYSSTLGSTSCADCPSEAFYCKAGSTAATRVPDGFVGVGANAAGEGAYDVQACPTGHACSQGAAVACASGRFANTTNGMGASACTQCPSGWRSELSSGSVRCVICNAGHMSTTPTSDACEACAGGQYQSSSGQSFCSSCGAGKFSTGGAEVCSPCGAGEFQAQSGSSVCTPCDAGRYTNRTGASTCMACTKGTFQSATNQTQCELCAMGYYSSSTAATEATPCDAGRYTDVRGSTVCSSCALGRFQKSTNATACDACVAGSFAGQRGMSECSACDFGTYQPDEGSSSCIACPRGTKGDAQGMTECTLCDAGEYNPSKAQSVCSQCDAGRYSAYDGASNCTAARLGHFVDHDGATGEVACSNGTSAGSTASTICATCAGGTFADYPAASSCELCAAGKFSTNGTCQLCPIGTFQSVAGADACSTCPSGRFSAEGAISCTKCAPGSYSDDPMGKSACSFCEPGTFSNTEQAISCQPCVVGRYTNSTNSTSCLLCPAGTHAPDDGMTECKECPSGSANALSGQGYCLACDSGTYAPVSGMTACAECQAGKYSKTGSVSLTACSTCDPGRWTGTNRSATCIECSGGLTVQDGGAKCEAANCEAGYEDAGTSNGACKLCWAGTWSDPARGVTRCTPCETGKYNLLSGSTDCVSCGLGLTCVGGQAFVESGWWAYTEVVQQRDDTRILVATAKQCPAQYCESSTMADLTLSNALSVEDLSASAISVGPTSAAFSIEYVNYSTSPCSAHRSSSPTNTLCGECEEGLVEWKGSCIECPKPNYGYITLVIVVCAAYICILHWLAQGEGSSAGLKVCIYFVQVALFMCGSVDTFAHSLGIINFGAEQASPPACVMPLSPYSWMALQVSMPYLFIILWVGLLVLALGAHGIRLLVFRFTAHKRPQVTPQLPAAGGSSTQEVELAHHTVRLEASAAVDAKDEKAEVASPSSPTSPNEPDATAEVVDPNAAPLFKWSRFCRSLLSVLLFTYQQGLQNTFAALQCVDVGTERVLFMSPSVDCRSSSYTRWLPLIYTVLVVNVILFPVGLAVWFWRHRRGIQSGAAGRRAVKSNIYRRYAGPLFLGFSRRGFFWSATVMGRQFLLVLLNFSLIQSGRMRYLGFLYLNLVLLALHLMIKPFHHAFDNQLESLSLFIHCLLAGLLACVAQPLSTRYALAAGLLIVPWACVLALAVVYSALRPSDAKKMQQAVEKQVNAMEHKLGASDAEGHNGHAHHKRTASKHQTQAPLDSAAAVHAQAPQPDSDDSDSSSDSDVDVQPSPRVRAASRAPHVEPHAQKPVVLHGISDIYSPTASSELAIASPSVQPRALAEGGTGTSQVQLRVNSHPSQLEREHSGSSTKRRPSAWASAADASLTPPANTDTLSLRHVNLQSHLSSGPSSRRASANEALLMPPSESARAVHDGSGAASPLASPSAGPDSERATPHHVHIDTDAGAMILPQWSATPLSDDGVASRPPSLARGPTLPGQFRSTHDLSVAQTPPPAAASAPRSARGDPSGVILTPTAHNFHGSHTRR